MLAYVSTGVRAFGERPLAPHRRPYWEFYAVLHGRIAPVLPSAKPPPKLRSSNLWVLSPGCEHGWRGERGRHATVAVFHFHEVPPELASACPREEFLVAALKPSDALRIAHLAKALQPHYWRGFPHSGLHAQRALLELSLLVLDNRETGTPADRDPESRVRAAETWFINNLGSAGNSLTAVACQVGLSVPHLRRLFMQTRGASPKTVFNRIRLEHAKPLLAHTDQKLETIATECGFRSASAFGQAFKKIHGVTPDDWRRRPA